jgi:predicted XRE-type DNA-binding protein
MRKLTNPTKKSKVNSKISSQEKKKFKEYLAKIEDPKNNQEVNYDLPENPTFLQVAKFNICQNILAYQQDNNLSDEELADQINLSIPEMEEILFCQIDKFTLDRLMTYANALFSPSQVKITIEKGILAKRKPSLTRRNTVYAR